ncbi:MAG TPA: PAS domain-containing protein [Bradyrhizobium sp.]|uniref:PAS domain-containing protein n=1 Tax=Bradyrhizobium sp. TaxID=376 RepID=UPI002D7F3B43|nr:PAS domain-containing protein [Bradyrhizobium sp.]HET7885645.1 PAS domain-containing protein [Bradyrhizobium sp.]
MEFISANPTVIKSIKQRDLLNTWLRLFAPTQRLPRLVDFQPDRIEEELPDLVFMTVEKTDPLAIVIDSDGTRMSVAFGYTGRGRYLDEYLGPRLAPQVIPIYQQCVTRALPAYSIADVDDARGRIVAYERLLLPFSDGGGVTHIIASLKTISEDGSFEIINLMRGNDALPTQKLRAVIDRDLFHRMPGRIPAADLVEFD